MTIFWNHIIIPVSVGINAKLISGCHDYGPEGFNDKADGFLRKFSLFFPFKIIEDRKIQFPTGKRSDHIVSAELVLTIQADGGLEQVYLQGAVGLGAQFVNDFAQVLVSEGGIVAAIVDDMLTLVVQNGNSVLGVSGHTLILEGQDGVHDGAAGGSILGLVVQTGHKGGTVNEHVLGGRSRAHGISLTPVGQGRVVVLLLVVLLIVV